MKRERGTLLRIVVCFLFCAGISMGAPLACAQARCEIHPHILDAANTFYMLKRALAQYEGQYAVPPGDLTNLTEPPITDADPVSIERAGLVRAKLLKVDSFSYELRYQNMAPSWKLWMTPKNRKDGCASFYHEKGGSVYLRLQDGDPATAADSPLTDVIPVAPKNASSRFVASFTPHWPRDLRKKGIEGTVSLFVRVNKEGRVANVTVFRGPAELGEHAAECVRRWIYQPVLIDGVPFEMETVAMVVFTLTR